METKIIKNPRIAFMLGSENDLGQALKALQFLQKESDAGRIDLCDVWINSIHRNPDDVMKALGYLIPRVDALIVGAGWANALTGCVNALLRNHCEFKNASIVVFGVAIEDPNDAVHTQAAIYGITQLPGSEVVFDNYVGEEGCLRAASDAASGVYPVIRLKEQKPARRMSFEDAIAIGQQKKS